MTADAEADLTTPRRSMGTAADASAAIETATTWAINIEEMEWRGKHEHCANPLVPAQERLYPTWAVTDAVVAPWLM
ncbi:hypothetical protein VC83_03285 [Pseudogymnoascus destructans]|uniref:Uncharacterized protein n=1 Tax=Pseudogymnoascus destructans TaxID=655981 RepID=A0A177AE19_9PEZI|nr:uncharacterized protein VC83_03285 [Pseudogymnoascus destructans]OAF60348.1 hypothetical protein VC83_03285 [Pseudogymnoascus destructans]